MIFDYRFEAHRLLPEQLDRRKRLDAPSLTAVDRDCHLSTLIW
jgi:hypothetical protein